LTPNDPAHARLLRTLEDLAMMGEKRAGTPAGHRAAQYLAERLAKAGLQTVTTEPFHFPRHDVTAAGLSLSIGGTRRAVGFDVLEASAPGQVDGELVWAGWAREEDLIGRDLVGKIALVERNLLYHRSTQYLNVARAGAAAMITVSTAPHNLRQVGSVRRRWEAVGPLPALTIGAADGATLKAALAAGAKAHGRLEVGIEVVHARGQNVLGHLPGWEPYQIVVGAHYDTWFAGSTDNGGGIAALLELAERRSQRMRPRYGLTFVAWDGEELALYGGYDFLRRHVVGARESILCVIDFETPAAHGAQLYGLAVSGHACLSHALDQAGLPDLFALNLPMDFVPELFGGVVPTDIQGLYREGTPAISTAVDSPYYHTTEDTPDKVDLRRLAAIVEGFDRVLDRLLAEPPERFQRRDAGLWRLELQARSRGQALLLDVLVRTGQGSLAPGARVEATLLADHFFEVEHQSARTDRYGHTTLAFEAEALMERPAPRYLHVTAGHGHPLVEAVVALD
jgi:hypothetical protein